MMNSIIDPISLLKPRRRISGISAILLPFTETGDVDWLAWTAHLRRTQNAGLMPAVNMDTGYVNFLDDATRQTVLQRTAAELGGEPFVAGAFVADQPGDLFAADHYAKRFDEIQQYGGLPIVFQSFGLVAQQPNEIVAAYQQFATRCDRFLGFELTKALAPFGAIYELETYAEIMRIPQCVGAKHSSFERQPEWERLQLRDRERPDFTVYTGNDFAIDMVMYGSDYLLGLSTFAPELFAKRDHYWETGNAKFYELNDQLQALGTFAFRSPGSAYKHSAAQFLKLRGWIDCDDTHPKNKTRPESDTAILHAFGQQLGIFDRGNFK